MGFAFLAACAAGVISGLMPALHQSRTDLNDVLKEASSRATTRSGQRLRGVFVVAELALALILLINAGLMVKGFIAIATQRTNMQPEGLLTFHVNLPESRYRDAQQLRGLLSNAIERLEALPRVQSAALATGLPYSFYDNSAKVTLEGRPEQPGQNPTAMAESISSGYFRTMHIPVRRGREFDERDRAGSPPAAIVTQAMADRLWPGEDAIGKRLKLSFAGAPDSWITVVGVVGDVRHEVYDRTFHSTAYLPYQQAPPRAVDFVLRTSVDPMAAVAPVRSSMRQLDGNQALEQIETMTVKIQKQASALRYVAALMIIFGLAALVLCSVGVYGLMAYSVAERRHEIGIRMALGAAPSNLLRTIAGRGMALTGLGLAVGIPSALVMAQLLSSLIYGVSPWDVFIFSAAPLLLVVVSGLACYIPANRAMKIDPLVALHYE
jgi:putative ABC transport system permease protein